MINMDTKALLCFKKVAELEHMTKAAQQLYISQAQLSRIIDNLEKEFGVKFFDRVGTGIKLNDYGKVFYKYVQQIFSVCDKAYTHVRDMYMQQQSQLTIVSNVSSYMPGLLKQFVTQQPGLKFRQISVSAKKSIQMIKDGRADFFLNCPLTDDIELKNEVLIKEPGIVIYPDKHRFQEYKQISLKQIKDEPLIAMNIGYGARDAADMCYENYGFKPNYVIEATETTLIPNYVKSGLGVAIVPQSMYIRDNFFKYHYATIEEPVFGLVCLSWHADRELSSLDRVFIDSVKAYFDALPRE